MNDKVRIGVVDYLNAQPLVYGLSSEGLGAERIELSHATPAELARRMDREQVDIALLPVVELARHPQLQVVPGLGICSLESSRSVLLVGKRPVDEVRSVALDPESRTSNLLVRLLFAEAFQRAPEFHPGPTALDDALERCDAAVRIGDKALFEKQPEGAHVHDLGTVWYRTTGLPFVYAVWAARPGKVDREIYRHLHDSRRRGSRNIERIAETYTWNGRRYPALAREYLTEHIRYRLGSAEVRALERFFTTLAALGLIERAPEIGFAFGGDSACHEQAASRATPSVG